MINPESKFRCSVFYSTMDILISQLTNRFHSFKNTVSYFEVLSPHILLNASSDEIREKAEKLQKKYEKDFSESLSDQLLSFKMLVKEDISKLQERSPKAVAELLISKYSCLASNIPDVVTAYLLFLTLPVTVAGAERSFSKLKMIKNYVRNSMSQECLKALAMLSIENDRANKINIDFFIDQFAKVSHRRYIRFQQ